MQKSKIDISELRYRRLFETAQDGILILNYQTGMIDDVNKFLLDILGFSKSDVLRKHLWEIGFFKDEKAQKENFKTLQDDGYVRFEDLPLETKSGKKIDVEFVANAYDVGGEMVIQCNVRDITDRVIAQNEVKKTQKRYRDIFDGSADALMLLGDNKFFDCNRATLKLFGYKTVKEFISKHPSQVSPRVQPDGTSSRELANKRIDEAFKQGVNSFEWVHRKKNGEDFNASVLLVPFEIDGKKVLQATVRDITKAKVAEIKLKESEYFFKESQRVANIGSYKFDLLTNTWTSSEILNNIFGIPQDYQKTYESWMEVIYPEDRKMMNLYFINEVIGEHKKFNKEYRIIRKSDGEMRWINGLGKVNYDTNNKAISMYGTILDITEHKKNEEKTKWLASFPTLSPHPVLEMEFRKGLVYTNPVAKKVFPGIKKNQNNHPFIKGVDKYFSKLLVAPNSSQVREVQVGDRWYLQTISPTSIDHVRIYATDITTLKLAQANMLVLKNRNESILESIGDAVLACDKNGKIQVFNKIAEEMTGIPSQNAIGKHYSTVVNFVREDDGKRCNDFIADAIHSNKITEMSNHVLLARRDGVQIPVADSAAPINDYKGNILGCVVVFHDMTKERKVDKAKTEFVSLASHQLRTPLSTINWYSEILLSEDIGPLNPKQQQYSKEVYHASQRMVALVNALLNVSRLELGTFAVVPKKVNITKIAKVSIKELKPQIILKNIVVKEKYDENVAQMNVDPKLMGIIFSNLLSNSVKYSRKGGMVELNISRVKNELLITVTDDGIGIPMSQQKEIFNKLFRADNAKVSDPDGSGLGLYIVKEIIIYAGGKVWFESREGKGTKFYVSLPMTGMIKKDNKKQLI